MHFSTMAAAALSVLSIASAAPTIEQRAITAQQTIDNTDKLTALSEQLDGEVSRIHTGITFPFLGPFQPVLDSFQQFIAAVADDSKKMQGTQPFDDDPAQLVCTAYGKFATVHSRLLENLSTKASTLTDLFTPAVRAAMTQSEAVVDEHSISIVSNVPACMEDATKNAKLLEAAYKQVICAYTPGGIPGNNC